MAVGIGVGEEAGLQDRVGGGLDAGNKVAWVESNLLDLGEIVDGIFVKGKRADLATWELLLRPDMCEIEDIDLLLLPNFLGLLRGHGLYFKGPLGIFASFNSFIHVFLRVVGAVAERVFLGDELGALGRFDVDLSIYPFAVLVDQFHRVTVIAVHEAPAIRNASVAHQDHKLMSRLGVL